MYHLPLKESIYLSSRKDLSLQATMCTRASCLGVFSMTAGKISKNAGLSLCDMRSTKQSSYMADNRRFGFNALKVFLSVLKQH